ncbi:MAG: DUF2059 domain-containing protein [Geminicoccales bacterium]
MKILRISVVAASLAIGAVPQMIAPSFAEDAPSPETLQAAHDLVAVFNEPTVAEAVANLTAQVWPTIEKDLRAQNPKIDAATAAELRKEYERLMTEEYKEIISDAPAVYARFFTAQEMRDLIAFYRTPAGAKSLRVMPQATLDLTAKRLERIQGLQEKVYLAFLNVLQKRGLYAN